MKYNEIEIYSQDFDDFESLSSYITKTEFESSSFSLEEIADLWLEMYGEKIFIEYEGFVMALINKITNERG